MIVKYPNLIVCIADGIFFAIAIRSLSSEMAGDALESDEEWPYSSLVLFDDIDSLRIEVFVWGRLEDIFLISTKRFLVDDGLIAYFFDKISLVKEVQRDSRDESGLISLVSKKCRQWIVISTECLVSITCEKITISEWEYSLQ